MHSIQKQFLKKRDYVYILFSLKKIFNYKNQISLSYQIDLKDQFKIWLLLRIASIECSIGCRIIKIKCRLLEIDRSNDSEILHARASCAGWNEAAYTMACRSDIEGWNIGQRLRKKKVKKNARGKKGKGADDRRTWRDDVIHSRDEGGRIHVSPLSSSLPSLS